MEKVTRTKSIDALLTWILRNTFYHVMKEHYLRVLTKLFVILSPPFVSLAPTTNPASPSPSRSESSKSPILPTSPSNPSGIVLFCFVLLPFPRHLNRFLFKLSQSWFGGYYLLWLLRLSLALFISVYELPLCCLLYQIEWDISK